MAHSSATIPAKAKPRKKSKMGRPPAADSVIQLSLFDAQIMLDHASKSVALQREVLIAAYVHANEEARRQIAAAYRETTLVAQSIAATRIYLRELCASVAA